MTCGIYMIQNLVNFKVYIGQSVDIEDRWKGHINAFNKGKGINKHFQNSWDKYGEDNFEFTILCECDESQLNTMEEYYIFELMTYDPDFGYNKNYGGNGIGTIQEIRDIIGEQSKKWWSNDEYRNTIINKSKDVWKDEEYRKKQYECNLLVHKYDRSTACLCINNGNVYKSVGDIYEELGRNKRDTSIYTNVRLNSKFEESQFETFKFRSFKGNYYIRYDVWNSLSPECRNYLKTNIGSLNKNRIG